MSWFRLCWKKYADFNGRAGRSEYWYFVLFNFIITMVLLIIGTIVANAMGYADANGNRQPNLVGDIPYMLYALAALLPSLAVAVRRLHDTGRSGWWLLIALVPLAGGIVLLIFYIMDGTPGPNQFGPNPRDAQMNAGVSPIARA